MQEIMPSASLMMGMEDWNRAGLSTVDGGQVLSCTTLV